MTKHINNAACTNAADILAQGTMSVSEDSIGLSAEELANCSNEGHVAHVFEQDQLVLVLGTAGELRFPGYNQPKGDDTEADADDFLRRLRENEGADMRELPCGHVHKMGFRVVQPS